MKKVSFLFIFVFSPLAFCVSGFDGSPEIDKPNRVEEIVNPKTVEIKDSLDIAISELSSWKMAKGTYYDPKDSTQTRSNPDGKGSFDRVIESGSIAIGSNLAKFFKDAKDDVEIFIEIKNLNVVTPYGKGIFRVDDTLNERYCSNHGKYFLDFSEEDLPFHLIKKGRFDVLFRIYKIRNI